MTLPLLPADAVRIGLRYGATEMRVFGSFARGTARPDSDLDLVVDLEPGRTLLDLIGLKQDLEAQAGRTVDVVTEASLHPKIRDRVLGDAVALDTL